MRPSLRRVRGDVEVSHSGTFHYTLPTTRRSGALEWQIKVGRREVGYIMQYSNQTVVTIFYGRSIRFPLRKVIQGTGQEQLLEAKDTVEAFFANLMALGFDNSSRY
jgi:hypothetical protein